MQSASSCNSHPPRSHSLTDDQMSLIASALLDMQRALNHQTILIAQLQDELAELRAPQRLVPRAIRANVSRGRA
jgi:hypothetical protein